MCLTKFSKRCLKSTQVRLLRAFFSVVGEAKRAMSYLPVALAAGRRAGRRVTDLPVSRTFQECVYGSKSGLHA